MGVDTFLQYQTMMAQVREALELGRTRDARPRMRTRCNRALKAMDDYKVISEAEAKAEAEAADEPADAPADDVNEDSTPKPKRKAQK